MKTDSSSFRSAKALGKWITDYKERHREVLQQKPEFAHWLEEEYVPLAGGWQY
jgi:hypothetical protein